MRSHSRRRHRSGEAQAVVSEDVASSPRGPELSIVLGSGSWRTSQSHEHSRDPLAGRNPIGRRSHAARKSLNVPSRAPFSPYCAEVVYTRERRITLGRNGARPRTCSTSSWSPLKISCLLPISSLLSVFRPTLTKSSICNAVSELRLA